MKKKRKKQETKEIIKFAYEEPFKRSSPLTVYIKFAKKVTMIEGHNEQDH